MEIKSDIHPKNVPELIGKTFIIYFHIYPNRIIGTEKHLQDTMENNKS